MGYCYPSGLERTLYKCEIYICPAGHKRVKSRKLNSILLCTSKAVKQSHYSPGEALRVPRVSQISRQSAYGGGKVVSAKALSALTPCKFS